jgi:hypothetical protein
MKALPVKEQKARKFKLYMRVKKEGKKVLVVKKKKEMEDDEDGK